MAKFFIPTLDEIQEFTRNIGGEALSFLVKAIFAILIFVIVRAIVRKFCTWLDKHLTKVEPTVKSFVLSLIKYGILGFTVLTIVIQLDIVSEASIAALIASAGVGISLAMQGTLSNFAGGILILMLHPFKVGDFISLENGTEGTVQNIDMYYTRILTIDNRMIVVPNATITNSEVINVTAEARRKLEIIVSISYKTDLDYAETVLKEILDQEPRLYKGDREVFFPELGESGVSIAFRSYVDTAKYWQVKWDLNKKIKQVFDEKGIEIPYNQIDVHIRENN